MLNMRRNHELFWILEVLLLTPVALFWTGVISIAVSHSDKLFLAVVGQPFEPMRSILVTMICPIAAGWLAHKYISENKKEKGASLKVARIIMLISITSVILVFVYLYGENRPR